MPKTPAKCQPFPEMTRDNLEPVYGPRALGRRYRHGTVLGDSAARPPPAPQGPGIVALCRDPDLPPTCPPTTYAGNIGVMAATRVYSTTACYVAAAVAILLGRYPNSARQFDPGGVLSVLNAVLTA